MPLSPGTRLGPYTILGELGAGGMGEVYRARDTRLDRDVALKIVPERLVSTSEARARLEREARAAARINHPHVCAIYDFGRERETSYLVLELVEGETLRDRLRAGPLDLDSLLSLGTDIAEALAAAHAKRIVHRDLKPGNIMVTPHGAKVMDFGVATFLHPEAELDTNDATRTDPALTTPGLTPGTTAYMSPEQARGEPVDERSDIFSLGSVLYEMATGKHPFPGSTTAVIFDSILNRAPVSPRVERPELPPGLDDIIGKALEKKRELRYQTASELAADLARLRWGPGPATSAIRKPPALDPGLPVSPRPSTRGVWIRWRLAAGAVALLLAVLWIAASLTLKKAPPPAAWVPRRLSLTGPLLDVDEWALSPDGAKAAYLPDSATVSVISLASNDSRALDHLEQDEGSYVAVDWTSNGSDIVATQCDRAGDVSLVRIDAVTGERDVLARLGRLGLVEAQDLHLALSPDGTSIAVRRGYRPQTGVFGQLDLVDVRTGMERLLVRATPSHVLPPVWVPNGRRITYVVEQGNHEDSRIETCDLRGVRTIVLEDSSGGLAPYTYAHPSLSWLGDDRLVYSAPPQAARRDDAALWVIPMNPATGRSSGRSELLYAMPGAMIHTPRLSSDGRRIAFVATRAIRQMKFIDTEGRPRFLDLAARGQLAGLKYPVWSPDGLALWARSDGNPQGSSIGRLRLGDGRFEPLTPVSTLQDQPLSVSPDGDELYSAIGSRLLATRASSRAPRVVASPFLGTILHANRSGRLLAIDHVGDDFVARDFDPRAGLGPVRFRYPARTMEERFRPVAALSPDGTRLALLRPDIPGYVVLDAMNGRELSRIDLPAHSFSQSVQWSADGRGLYASGTDVLAPFWIARLAPHGVDRVLWRDNAVWPGELALSPDGTTLAFATISFDNEMWMIERP